MSNTQPDKFLELKTINLKTGKETPTITIPLLTPGYERRVPLSDDTDLSIVWRYIPEKPTTQKRSSNHVTQNTN